MPHYHYSIRDRAGWSINPQPAKAPKAPTPPKVSAPKAPSAKLPGVKLPNIGGGAAEGVGKIAGVGAGLVNRATSGIERVAGFGERFSQDAAGHYHYTIPFRGSSGDQELGLHGHFDPSKHPRGEGGKFGSGGGSSVHPLAQPAPQPKQTLATRAREKVGQMAHNFTKEDMELLTKNTHAGGSQPRITLGRHITQTIPNVVMSHIREEGDNLKHTGGFFNSLRKGQKPTSEQWQGARRLGTRALMIGAGALHGDPTGTIAGFAHHAGEELLNHLMAEHGAKFAGGALRAFQHLTGSGRREGATRHHGDALFRDAVGCDPQCYRDMVNFLHHLAEIAQNHPISTPRMIQLMRQNRQAHRDSRNMPMFGGLAGNALGDAGTSEGVKKAWRKRKAGKHFTTSGVSIAPNKPPTTQIETSSGKTLSRLPPPAPQRGTAQQVGPIGEKPKPGVIPKNRGPAERVSTEGPARAQSSLAKAAGEEPSKRNKGKLQQGMPTYFQRKQMTPSEREREYETAEKERAGYAREDFKKELQSLRQRHKAGETLTEKELARMNRLGRAYGGH